MKVVFDTNVWVSALIKPQGVSARIFEATTPFQSVTSKEIIVEVERVLHYDKIQKKHGLSDTEIAEHLRLLQQISKVETVKQAVTVIKDDPTDNKFLACAKAGKVDHIITGDPHLTTLGSFEGITILTPGQFLDILKQSKR